MSYPGGSQGRGNYNQGNRGGGGAYNQGNRGGGGAYNQGNRGGGGAYNQGNRGGGGNYNQGNRGGGGAYNQGNRGGGYNQGGGAGGGYQGGRGGRQLTYSDAKVSEPVIQEKLEYHEGQIPAAKEDNIVVNSYQLAMPGRAVYQYELKFFAVYNGINDGPRRLVDLSTFKRPLELHAPGEQFVGRDFATREILPDSRRKCITKLYDQLFIDYHEFFDSNAIDENGGYLHVYAYDRSSIFYCSRNLPDLHSTYTNRFQISLANIHPDVMGSLKNPREIFATLKQTRFLDPLAADVDPVQLKTYLEILFSQKQLDDVVRFVKFGPKVFDLASRPEAVDSSCTLKDGQQKSVNIARKDGHLAGNLQIDASISPFHTSISLPDYIYARWGYTDKTDFANHEVLKNLAGLKGVFVRTTHRQVNDLFRIEKLTTQGAQATTFSRIVDGQEQRISVAAYFLQTYGIQLEYPDLPCVSKLTSRRRNPITGEKIDTYAYYPIECLIVQQGQKYHREDMSPDQERAMIANSQRRPGALMEEIRKQLLDASLTSGDDLVRTAQVGIEGQMSTMPSKVLAAPVITYSEPGSGKKITFAEWGVRDSKFIKPATIKAVLVIYERKNEELAYKFQNEVINGARDFGMQIGTQHYEALNDLTYPTLKNTILKFRDEKGVDFVFLIADDSVAHHNLKSTEAFTNVKTQQIKPKTLINKGNRIGFDTKANILAKTNPKNGGYNQCFQQDVVGVGQVDVLRSFMKKTLVIGIQLSHPSPGMEEKTPSVCGYAYNVHDTGNVARGGFYYLNMNPLDENSANNVQPGRGAGDAKDAKQGDDKGKVLKEEHLWNILNEAVGNYYTAQNGYPERVLIYRFGTSEGEFNKIQNEECETAQQLLNSFEENVKIKLTVLLVFRQHNIRLFKTHIDENLRAPQQNVPPGTCVPGNKENEFVIVAHRALQGTAKPTLYSVVYPVAKDLPVNLLESITHTLCYMHEIVPSAISVPAHLRNAEQMATRGRNLWKTRHNEMDALENLYVDPAPFFNEATNKLQPSFHTRYWA